MADGRQRTPLEVVGHFPQGIGQSERVQSVTFQAPPVSHPAPTIYGTVTIKRRVPSQNKSTYAHWSVYHKEKQAWAILMGAGLPKRTPPSHPVHIRLTSYRVRLCDYANLVGGAKIIPDILKARGYIRDDSVRWFRCDYFQVQVPKADERTVVEFLSPFTP
jgi:hypothetical protein